jgi:hypothetical protein
MGLQNHGSPNFGNFETPNLGVPRQNDIWVQAPWLGIENIIRGKVVVSPKFRSWWVCEFVFAHGSSVHRKCSNYALTNLLFGLCRFVWVIDLFLTCPNSHPIAVPLYPWSAMNWGAYLNSLSFQCFHLGFVVEFIKELGGTSHVTCTTNIDASIIWLEHLKFLMYMVI